MLLVEKLNSHGFVNDSRLVFIALNMDLFKYDPIDLEGPAFRLLRLLKGDGCDISCEIFHAYLPESRHDSYHEALSYTWGSMEKTRSIDIRGRRLKVTENVYLALRQLRSRDHDKILWVDAICIDQDNIRERGHQVQHMGQIYEHASTVIFWLGQPTKSTDILMDSLQLLQNRSKYSDWRPNDLRWSDLWITIQRELEQRYSDLAALQREGLQDLLNRPWFKRVWILQEVANAQAARVFCGTKSVLARIFALAPRLIRVKPHPHCQAVLDIMPSPSEKGPRLNQSHDLYTLLRKFGQSEASDERDLIYALLGMSSDANKSDFLRPDYKKSVRDLTSDVIRFLYFYDISLGPDEQLWTIQDLLSQLRSLNRIAVKRLIEISRKENIGTLLTRVDFEMTKEVHKAVAEHDTTEGVTDLFLRYRGSGIKITMEVIDDAAKYLSQKGRIMDLIVRPQGGETTGYEAVLKLLLAADTDIEARLIDGHTPLSYAAEKGYVPIVKLLLATGADVDSQSETRNDGATMAKLLFTTSADFREQDDRGRTLLSYAAEKGYEAAALLLIQKGINVESADHDGRTPLLWAIRRGREAIVRLLLFNGANIESTDNDGRTPLLWAAGNGYGAIVQLLLYKGANTKSTDKDGRTPLLWAAGSGHEDVVERLISMGASIDSADKDGRTPLLWAAGNGHEAVVQLLLRKGANIDSADKDGRTPLLWAARKGHEGVMLLLHFKRTNVKLTDRDGRSPLLLAAGEGHEDVVQTLLNIGDNIESVDNNGRTPLSCAAEKGHMDVVRLLLFLGANVESTDKDGRTPRWWAGVRGHTTVMRVLAMCAEIESADRDGLTLLFRTAGMEYAANTHLYQLHRSQSGATRRRAVVHLLDDIYDYTNSVDMGGGVLESWATERGHSAIMELPHDDMEHSELEDEDLPTLEWGTEDRVNIGLTNHNAGRTPLSYAAQRGNEAAVQLLLDNGADTESTKGTGVTPLRLAAEMGHEAVVRLLLSGGANGEHSFGWTPLLWAARNGHEAVVQLLLEKGVNTELTDESGRTPLYWAASNGRRAVLRLLIEKGANTGTPLLVAAMTGDEIAVKLLLDNGVEIDLKDEFGQTPLLCAAQNGHEAVMRLLLDKRADVELADDIGRTPLLRAAQNGHEAVARLLLDKGTHTELVDGNGRTPLSWATENGHIGVVRLLLQRGANMESMDNYKQTPRWWATEMEHTAILSMFRRVAIHRNTAHQPSPGGVVHSTEELWPCTAVYTMGVSAMQLRCVVCGVDLSRENAL